MLHCQLNNEKKQVTTGSRFFPTSPSWPKKSLLFKRRHGAKPPDRQKRLHRFIKAKYYYRIPLNVRTLSNREGRTGIEMPILTVMNNVAIHRSGKGINWIYSECSIFFLYSLGHSLISRKHRNHFLADEIHDKKNLIYILTLLQKTAHLKKTNHKMQS